MLTSLTPEQEELLPVYSQKWIEIGLSTDPIDVEKSLAALDEIYKNGGLETPTKHEIYDSPIAAVKAMKEKYDVEVDSKDFIYGAHEAHWLSRYDYFYEVCDIKQCEKLLPFMELAKYCGWVLVFDDLIVLTQKPIKIKFDAENRTHCEDGFAIEFKDGTGVAVWHGQQIPQEWVFDKSTLTADVFLRWENIEQRRCACEIVGWAEVLKALEAKVIDEDEDPTIGKLLEVNLPDSGDEKFLLAIDPNTQSYVGIPVPEEMTTALEANSWTYGIEKEVFKPDLRV